MLLPTLPCVSRRALDFIWLSVGVVFQPRFQ